MAVTRKDVEHIAQLAKLSLEENEVESLTDQNERYFRVR